MPLASLLGQKTISGRILDNELEPLPGAIIFNSDTIEIGKADINGYFELTIPDETYEIIFGFVGCELRAVTFNDSCKYFEVIVLLNWLYHTKSGRKIDRHRKKEFDKLPELHRNAFNEGKFLYEKACYTSKFTPIKPALDIIKKEIKELRKANTIDFKNLNIGDVVRIPFGVDTSNNENIIRTHFAPCANCTTKDFDYLIKGEVVRKYRRRLTLEIKITELLPYDFLNYRGKVLNVGSTFKYEMKFYEVITDKKDLSTRIN